MVKTCCLTPQIIHDIIPPISNAPSEAHCDVASRFGKGSITPQNCQTTVLGIESKIQPTRTAGTYGCCKLDSLTFLSSSRFRYIVVCWYSLDPVFFQKQLSVAAGKKNRITRRWLQVGDRLQRRQTISNHTPSRVYNSLSILSICCSDSWYHHPEMVLSRVYGWGKYHFCFSLDSGAVACILFHIAIRKLHAWYYQRLCIR